MGGLGLGDNTEPSAAGGRVSGVTLDAGALIGLDRDDRRIIVLLARAAETKSSVTIPATA